MKKKPILLKAIKEESLKKSTEQKINNIESDKLINSIKKENNNSKTNNIIDEELPIIKKEKVKENNNILKIIFGFILKIFILIINLLISIFESFQWLFMSLILTIAAIIILNYLNIDTKDIGNAVLKLIQK